MKEAVIYGSVSALKGKGNFAKLIGNTYILDSFEEFLLDKIPYAREVRVLC